MATEYEKEYLICSDVEFKSVSSWENLSKWLFTYRSFAEWCGELNFIRCFILLRIR